MLIILFKKNVYLCNFSDYGTTIIQSSLYEGLLFFTSFYHVYTV